MALVLDLELALAEGVPELDGLVAGAGDDLSVVGAEGDGEDVLGVANEALGGETSAVDWLCLAHWIRDVSASI